MTDGVGRRTGRRFCDDSPDPAFNSCSVPQELTNDEIDQEVAGTEVSPAFIFVKLVRAVISRMPLECANRVGRSRCDSFCPVQDEDESDKFHGLDQRRPVVWQLIKENIYTHRAPKVQDEDDIMLCQCKPPQDGGAGCGPDCLNRLLNMECVPVSRHAVSRHAWRLQSPFNHATHALNSAGAPGLLSMRRELQQSAVFATAVCSTGKGAQQLAAPWPGIKRLSIELSRVAVLTEESGRKGFWALHAPRPACGPLCNRIHWRGVHWVLTPFTCKTLTVLRAPVLRMLTSS